MPKYLVEFDYCTRVDVEYIDADDFIEAKELAQARMQERSGKDAGVTVTEQTDIVE